MRDMAVGRDGDVVLGDDWVTPDSAAPDEILVKRERRGLFSLRTSPLTRKIITFNLIALSVLVAGILYLNSSRDSLAMQRAAALVSETELIADVIEAQLPAGAPVNLTTVSMWPPRLMDWICVAASKSLSTTLQKRWWRAPLAASQ